jgi:hypothetical protein
VPYLNGRPEWRLYAYAGYWHQTGAKDVNIVRKVLQDRYRDLACLAYLISDDGLVDEQRLAAGVHQALWEAVPRELRRTGRSADDAADVYVCCAAACCIRWSTAPGTTAGSGAGTGR